MCKCNDNVKFGDYSRMDVITTKEGKKINVDKCLTKEIEYLISLGVKTIECCCGHNKVSGYIAVGKESIDKMKELGYKRCINPFCPNNDNFFKPKITQY